MIKWSDFWRDVRDWMRVWRVEEVTWTGERWRVRARYALPEVVRDLAVELAQRAPLPMPPPVTPWPPLDDLRCRAALEAWLDDAGVLYVDEDGGLVRSAGASALLPEEARLAASLADLDPEMNAARRRALELLPTRPRRAGAYHVVGGFIDAAASPPGERDGLEPVTAPPPSVTPPARVTPGASSSGAPVVALDEHRRPNRAPARSARAVSARSALYEASVAVVAAADAVAAWEQDAHGRGDEALAASVAASLIGWARGQVEDALAHADGDA